MKSVPKKSNVFFLKNSIVFQPETLNPRRRILGVWCCNEDFTLIIDGRQKQAGVLQSLCHRSLDCHRHPHTSYAIPQSRRATTTTTTKGDARLGKGLGALQTPQAKIQSENKDATPPSNPTRKSRNFLTRRYLGCTMLLRFKRELQMHPRNLVTNQNPNRKTARPNCKSARGSLLVRDKVYIQNNTVLVPYQVRIRYSLHSNQCCWVI